MAKQTNNVKEWYTDKFPSDELGNELNSEATFDGLNDNLPNVYEYLGVADSLVRERVFIELSIRLKVDYSVIYNGWLQR